MRNTINNHICTRKPSKSYKKSHCKTNSVRQEMASDSFMSKVRSFFGLRQEPPRNEFRNPIWGDDEEDDVDELFRKQQQTLEAYTEGDIHRAITKHMQDVFKSFGDIFGDMKSIFHDDIQINTYPIPDYNPEPDTFNSNSLRDYYLKPGYRKRDEPKDMDLDGKISSQEISGLLKKKGDAHNNKVGTVEPFDGNLVPGRSFCQTIITTSVTKPDGTIETRRIIKNGNEVIEETTTSSSPDSRGPITGPITISSSGKFLADLTSLFRNFY